MPTAFTSAALRWPLVLLLVVFGYLPLLAAPEQMPEIRISINPDDKAIEQNVLAQIALGTESCDAPRWLIEALAERLPDEIDAALRALGYYQGHSQYQLDFTADCWSLAITVQSGPPTLLAKVQIEVIGPGADEAAFARQLALLPLKTGEQLHHGQYTRSKQLLLGTAMELGFLEARFARSDLLVNPARQAADVVLVLETGPRYRIGQHSISALYLRPELVERLVDLPPGEDYDAARVAAAYRTLRASGYFSTIQIKPDLTINPEHNIDIVTDLTMNKRHVYRFGIGYKTDIGVRTSALYENRFINRRGDRLQAELQLAQELAQFDLNYNVLSNSDPLNRFWTFGLQTVHERTSVVESDRLRAGVAWNQRRDKLSYQYRLDFLAENSTLAGEDINSHFLIPAARLQWRDVDNDLAPTKGLSAFVEVQSALDGMLASTSFVRVHTGARALMPLGKGSLFGRIEYGALETSDFNQIPASLRFFAGGDDSVRGYGYQELSPMIDDKFVGGQYLLTSSIEYQHPLTNKLSGAVFLDAGNASDSWDMDLKYGAGVGLRWKTPVGRVKLDVAVPNDRSRDNYRIHVGFGVEL